MMKNPLPLTKVLLREFDKEVVPNSAKKISVNPVVAEVASWYEKFRNAMDYRDEEVILAGAIERILRRRFLLGGKKDKIASLLIRELAWARYFPDRFLPETVITDVSQRIDLYSRLYDRVVSLRKNDKNKLYDFLLQSLSADIGYILNPHRETQLMADFMFHTFQKMVVITDDTDQEKDIQVYIALHRAFAKEDQALLRYHLFVQYFSDLSEENLASVVHNFESGFTSIESALNYPLKDQIYSFVKRQTPAFFILEDILKKNQGENNHLLIYEDQLEISVRETCSEKYRDIYGKVRRAVVRSIAFLFLTKAMFALSIEGSFESIVYGKVIWRSIALNTMIPPLLMFLVSLYIKIPNKKNTDQILEKIKGVLFEENYQLAETLTLTRLSLRSPFLDFSFKVLWLLAYILSFGAMFWLLKSLHFNFVSMLVFVFFLAVVSFLSYRINQTARMYTVLERKPGIGTVIFDFFFMPFVQLGRHLTIGISQLNIFLFIFDFIIEAPFKGIFAFFEDWFFFLQSQREKLN